MRAKKSLGQHFLYSRAYLTRIVDAAMLSPHDTVLEIGPGTGALTEVLLEKGVNVIAIEKDHRAIEELEQKFKTEVTQKKLKIIEEDFLETDLSTLNLKEGSYSAVGNIPYYITGSIIRKLLSQTPRPKRAVLLVQKEVAERIARSKKESILSLSVKAYGEPHYIQKVPRGAFTPPPTVDSAILLIDHISADNFSNKEGETRFFGLLHAGFGQKRKLLRRNIESFCRKEAEKLFEELQIPQNARAEDVPLEKWLKLSTFID